MIANRNTESIRIIEQRDGKATFQSKNVTGAWIETDITLNLEDCR